MELRDYIMKFPPYWQGIFAPLSKDRQPILGADSWLLENREAALTCHAHGYSKSSSRDNHVNWRGFIEGLCEEEPAEAQGQLVFLPRILLFPVNIQRNVLAFLSHHLVEIPTQCLEKLLDSLKNRPPSDEWTKHHLRIIQDFVCRKQCRDFGSGHSTSNHRSKLTPASQDSFENICQQIGVADANRNVTNEGWTLQFDWLPGALSTSACTCQHSAYFASDFRSPELRMPSSQNGILTSQGEDSSKHMASPIDMQRSDSNSPNIIEICDSSPSHPMHVETIAAEKSPEKVSEESDGNQRASEDLFGGESSQSNENLSGQRVNTNAIDDRKEDNGHHAIDAVTMDKLTSLKATLCSTTGEPIPSELLGIIIDCPTDQVEAFCDVLDLDSLPAAGLGTLVQQLSNCSLELSHLSATTLARRCFSKQVQNLTQTAPRTLLSALVCLARAFPKPTIEGALLPALAREGHAGAATSHQCDLVAKVVKEALTNESRVYLLRKVLSVQTLHWSEEMTGLFQMTLACKLELDSCTLEMFISALVHHGSSQNSCAKFAKLLLAVVNRFSKQISATSLAALQRLADANQTFLKKALLAALKRIKG